MTIHPVQDEPAPEDTTFAMEPPADDAPADPLEEVMLAQDRIFVVLAVVLVIWLGIMFYVYWTDRKIRQLEKEIEQSGPDSSETPPSGA